MKKFGFLFLILSLIAMVIASKKESDPIRNSRNSDTTCETKWLEIPLFTLDTNEQIIKHSAYTLSYNKQNNEPNWVAWQLTDKETEGVKPRKNNFLPDPSIAEPYQVIWKDYAHSGFDRGHMAPSADMKFNEQAMEECFYMSNVCPQNAKLNQNSWKTLENACRRWAKTENNIYIVCGPLFFKSPRTYIGKYHPIAVPEAFFKVILSTQKGKEKAIGFIYKNIKNKQPMQEAVRSVDQVEQITKMNFFSLLPDALESKIEATSDLKKWH
ncbi:MAG: DNA/RNA non-specific endonuclease [Bacteroidaceae bacterium]